MSASYLAPSVRLSLAVGRATYNESERMTRGCRLTSHGRPRSRSHPLGPIDMQPSTPTESSAAVTRAADPSANGRSAPAAGDQPPMLQGPQSPRYLVDFHPKRVPHYFTDVLIIGGGLAGLRAANAVADDVQAIVVTKDKLQESNSNYAQGGIASVWDAEDCFEDHVQDTLAAGGNFCDEAVVDMVVREAPSRVAELIAWGTNFDAREGRLLLGREGGHSHERILHALGDATGKEIMRAVIERTRARQNIQIWERTSPST